MNWSGVQPGRCAALVTADWVSLTCILWDLWVHQYDVQVRPLPRQPTRSPHGTSRSHSAATTAIAPVVSATADWQVTVGLSPLAVLCCISLAWPLLTRQRWDAPQLLIQLLWTACHASARACGEEHRSFISLLQSWSVRCCLNCCVGCCACSGQDYVKNSLVSDCVKCPEPSSTARQGRDLDGACRASAPPAAFAQGAGYAARQKHRATLCTRLRRPSPYQSRHTWLLLLTGRHFFACSPVHLRKIRCYTSKKTRKMEESGDVF